VKILFFQNQTRQTVKTKTKKILVDKKLQKAFDSFPKVLKAKEKAAKEKKRIMKNFMSVKNQVYK
jgi:hypothetical protein